MAHQHIDDHSPVHRHFNASDMSIATGSWWSWSSLFLSFFLSFLSFFLLFCLFFLAVSLWTDPSREMSEQQEQRGGRVPPCPRVVRTVAFFVSSAYALSFFLVSNGRVHRQACHPSHRVQLERFKDDRSITDLDAAQLCYFRWTDCAGPPKKIRANTHTHTHPHSKRNKRPLLRWYHMACVSCC